MRGFFLLLILSNAIFFGWQYYQQRGDSGVIDVYRDIAMVSNGLTLLSELPEGERPKLREGEAAEATSTAADEGSKEPLVTEQTASEEKGGASTAADPAAPHCYRVANIEEKQQLNALVAWLSNNGASDIEQGPQQLMQTRYWVMLPAYASRAKANEAAEILASRRVKDFFIVRSGENENAVSLGVFSTRERAERRYAQIVALKARLRRPRIDTVERTMKRYQASFRLGGTKAQKRLSAYLERVHLSPASKMACK